MSHGARISVPTDRQLSMMDAKDRPPGIAGKLASEIHASNIAKAEKDLQDEIRRYLNFHQIPFICPPMNKKSSLPIGWSDFSVFPDGGRVVFWECKAVGASLRPEQIIFRDRIVAYGYPWRLIRHLGEAQAHLREISGGEL